MAYHFENIKLEKGMYGRSGRSFSQALEELDPSEHYRGTPLEGLDAFQRQLKRFDIHVKGAGSDMVEKFFHTGELWGPVGIPSAGDGGREHPAGHHRYGDQI